MKLIINGEVSLQEAFFLIKQKYQKDRYLILTIENAQRTLTQNRAIHLYFTMLASELNEKGLDIRKVLRESFNIPWSKDSVKELIWCEVQKSMFGTTSTKQLTTDQVSQVFDVIHLHLINTFEVDVQFPSKDHL